MQHPENSILPFLGVSIMGLWVAVPSCLFGWNKAMIVGAVLIVTGLLCAATCALIVEIFGALHGR